MREIKFQLGVILIITISNLIFYMPIPINLNHIAMNTNDGQIFWVCSLKNLPFYKSMSIFYFVESSLLPFFIMLITTVLTVRALVSSRMHLKSMMRENSELRLRRVKDIKFAINSIALNVLYVLLQSPIALSLIVNFNDQSIYLLAANAASIFYYLNFSINFFAHFMSNSIFKREFFYLLGFILKSFERMA